MTDEMAKVQRERITRSRVVNMDTHEIVDAIHDLEDKLERMERRYDMATDQLSNSSSYGYSMLMEDLGEEGLLDD